MTTPAQYEAEIDAIRAMNLKLKILLTDALETIAANARNAVMEVKDV